MTISDLEAVSRTADSPSTDHSVNSLINGYRAELVVPPNRKVSQLSELYVGANLEEIASNLNTLRQKTDAHFLNMRDRAERDLALRNDIEINEQRRSRLARYPIKCCLQITRHVLFLLSQEPEVADLTRISQIDNNFHCCPVN